MKYRAEIDGLRAVAVVPVILFHAGFEIFRGGFVGVDVFFVISGYLITTILIEDMARGQFTVAGFYERRARRILPALFLVMAVCIPLAWALLPPVEMASFARSVGAVSLFISNILFWKESGYFDAIEAGKPLLHTWSLAVEEQYYLLFPLFLMAAWRFGKAKVFWAIVAVAALSLALTEWGWRYREAANFFLAPTRAWELLAGSIAAFIVQRRGVQGSNALSLVGVAAIAFAITVFDKHTPFPSLYTLVPVLGVLLLILFAAEETLAARVLGAKPLVGVGLISYSAYLWHQPLFAFYWFWPAPETTIGYAVLALAVFPLAYLSWRFVEQPFRNKQVIGRRGIFSLALVGTICFLAFAVVGHKTNGFEERPKFSQFKDLIYDTAALGYTPCNNALDGEEPVLSYCHTTATPPGALLVGDSHADDKFYGVAKAMPGYNWMLIGNGSCPPLIGVNVRSVYAIECTARLEKVFSYIEGMEGVKLAILSFAHMYPLDHFIAADHLRRELDPNSAVLEDQTNSALSKEETFYGGLARVIELLQRKGIQVVLLYDIPELTFFPKDCFINKAQCGFSTAAVLERQQVHRARLAALAVRYGVKVFDPLGMFCEGPACSILMDGRSLYRDSHHLTLYGSGIYGQRLADFLKR